MHRLKRKGAIRCIRRLKYLYHAQAQSLSGTTYSHCAVVFPLRGKADAYGEVPGQHPLKQIYYLWQCLHYLCFYDKILACRIFIVNTRRHVF